MSDEKYVGAVAAAKQAALIKAYVDSKMKKDFVVNITFDSTSAPSIIDDANLAVFTASADKTFAEISAAVAAGKNVYGMCDGLKWPLYLASSTSFAFRGHIQLANLFGTVGLAIAICSIWQDGCNVEVSAGELPVPALDGSDDGKCIAVSGYKWEMKKSVVDVDDALSDTSTNPVQNKVVKAALDGKASTEVATQTANGLMSAKDKTKLDGVAEGANKTTVIDALDPLSHNPVSSAALFEALSNKADRTEATEHAAGLMSAFDKKKLNGIEDGANKTIVDEMLSDGSTNPVQNKAITAALASVVRETIYPITVTATSTEWVVNNGIAYKEASADRTFDDIKAASIGNKTPVCEFEGMTYSLILTSSTAFVFASYRGAVANDPQYAGLGKYPTSLITINTTGVVISRTAGDLPAVEGTDNGKMLIVAGGEWALQRVPGATVDAELSNTSENPVQNKTVTDALNGKLPKTGGTVTGALRTNDSFSAGGTISFGEAPIGLSQTADGAAEIRYGSADVDDNPPPLSRLKVARPTKDDDAATKKYVDDRNDSPQFKGYVTLTPANGTLGHGVGLSPTGSGYDYTLNISDVDEGWPTLLTGVKTPTDADTNAAATVEYVKAKVASGGVTVDAALDATSTNPVQNKAVKAALDGKAGTAVATTSANGLMSKDDKAKLDGITGQVTVANIYDPEHTTDLVQYGAFQVAAQQIISQIPTVLPSPNALTVTSGSNSVTYDGSADKIIDIPSVEKIVTETTQVLPAYTNLIPISTDASGAVLNGVGYEAGALHSDGSVASASSFTSGFIPVKKGDVVRIKDPSATNFSLDNAVALYKADKAISTGISKYIRGLQSNAVYGGVTISGDVLTWDTSSISYYAWQDFKYLRVMTSSADSIVTINEEIKESTQTVMTLKPTVKVSKDSLNFAVNEPMLAGRKIVVFGDSLIGMTRDQTSVTAYAAEYTGAKVYNVGFGGCRMSKHPTNGYAAFSMWALADAVATGNYATQEAQAPSGADYFASQLDVLKSIDFETVDAIVIHYGTNDFTANVPLDNSENLLSTDTVCGALRYSIKKILDAYPKIKIFVSLPLYRTWDGVGAETYKNTLEKTLPEYDSAMKTVAENHNLPTIDGYKQLGVNSINSSAYLSDGTHLNDFGRKQFGEFIGGRLICGA